MMPGLLASWQRRKHVSAVSNSYDLSRAERVLRGTASLGRAHLAQACPRHVTRLILPGQLHAAQRGRIDYSGSTTSFERIRKQSHRPNLTVNHMMIGFSRPKGSRTEARMSNNYHSATVEWLGSWIASGKVQPGEALKVEAGLCEELGVSRTVIREAIKTLVAKGMLDVGPKVGTRVTPVRSWNLFDVQVVGWLAENGLPESFVMDLIDLRRTIEPTAVRWACERATPRQIAEIQAAYQLLAASLGDKDEYNRADKLFHEAVLAASHNQFIERMVPALGALLAVSFEVSSTVPDELGLTLPLHKEIADAIASRDGARGVWACMTLIERAALTISRHYPELVVSRGEQTAP